MQLQFTSMRCSMNHITSIDSELAPCKNAANWQTNLFPTKMFCEDCKKLLKHHLDVKWCKPFVVSDWDEIPLRN